MRKPKTKIIFDSFIGRIIQSLRSRTQKGNLNSDPNEFLWIEFHLPGHSIHIRMYLCQLFTDARLLGQRIGAGHFGFRSNRFVAPSSNANVYLPHEQTDLNFCQSMRRSHL